MKIKYFKLPYINPDFIKKQDYFLLFETTLFDKENYRSFIFINPLYVIKIQNYKDVEYAFCEIEEYAKRYYLAGYFSYELGYFFEKDSFKIESSFRYPLIHLCVFDQVITFNHKTGKLNKNVFGLFNKREKNQNFWIKNLRLNFTESEYIKRIKRIKQYIREGQTYQVNFTQKIYFDFLGSAFSFYNDLKERQNTPYSAFCKFKDEYVISLSVELFLRKDNNKIYSKPMKGTIKRGRNIQEDKEKAKELKECVKNQAENLMIVDLIRNDLGRISRTGSVKVIKLFEIEKYNTLFQMTSTIKSILRKNISYFDIFKSLFPGGSVTGAPKIRTMQIIKELEKSARKIYCGALGIIFPNNKAIFNLPIRTISLLKNKAEMGIGGGIVIDSDPKKEFQECLLKAKFLTDRYNSFSLLETIGLFENKFKFLNAHLKRLKNSAEYFNFYFNRSEIILKLKNLKKKLKNNLNYKIRLLLDKEGNLKIDYQQIKDFMPKRDNYIVISQYKTDPENLFLYHKTTNRNLYDHQYNYYAKKGYFDVIFLNKKNEVTEGAISNIIIQKNNKYYTPVLSSGLLPGIFRQYFIKKHKVIEKKLFLKDLIKADKIFLCNSVRGLNEVKIKWEKSL